MENNIFNRKLIRLQQERNAKNFFKYDYLQNWTSKILFENFCDRITILQNSKVNNNEDNLNILEVGAKNQYLPNVIQEYFLTNNSQNCKIKYYQSGFSSSFYSNNHLQGIDIACLVADDQFLPFASNSFDVIFTNLNFHFLNNPKLFLDLVFRILKKNGILLISYFGEGNLLEFYLAIQRAQFAIYQGNFPIIPPVVPLNKLSQILQESKFANIVTNKEEFLVNYPNFTTFLKDISKNSQGNFLNGRNVNFISKRLLKSIEYYYLLANNKADTNKVDGKKIEASFKINIAVASKP